MNSAPLIAIAFSLYLLATVCYGAIVFLQAPAAPPSQGSAHPAKRPGTIVAPLVMAGVIVLFAAIGATCISTHRSPFAGEYGTLVFAAWAISVIYLVVDRKRQMPAMGALAMLTVCIVLGFAHSRSQSHIASDPVLSDPIVTIHVCAIIVSYGLILAASLAAGLYLLQDRQLKSHSESRLLSQLPPLTRLDSVGFQCVAYALPLVSIGLGVGIALVHGGSTQKAPYAWVVDPRFISTSVLWLLFISYLVARLSIGWRGVRLQYILLIGILMAFAAYALPTASAHHFN